MTNGRRVLISGGSGLIGSRLIESLQASGNDVSRLVRRSPEAAGEYEWDPHGGYIDDRALKGVDVVVHLSGASIGSGRWTEERKRVLRDSRITTTRVLAEHLAHSDESPSVLIAQSAIGIYGERGDEVLTERSPMGPNDDFLASLTADWEAAARPAADSGIRVVHPRTGIVISREAQLIKRLAPLFKAGLGGPLGTGRQWWSWISLGDNVRALRFLIDSELAGPFNLVSPEPVRQREFSRVLAQVLKRPSLIPAPGSALRLALGGEKAQAIGLSSTRAIPDRLLAEGFEFEDANLERTLRRELA